MNQAQTYYKRITLLEILVGFRLILSFVPAVEEYSPFVVNLFSVVLIWVILFSSGGAYVGRKMLQVCPLYLIAFVNILWGYKSTTLPFFIYGMLQWFIYPVAISYMIDNDQKYPIIRLLILSFVCIAITCVTTYIGNEAFPGASRALAAIWADDAEQAHVFRKMNIGGFDFAYLLTLLIPLLVFLIKNKVGKLYTILIVVLGALAFTAIVATEYTTALVFAILGLVPLFLPKDYSTKQLIRVIAVGAIVLFAATATISAVFDHLSNNIESGIIAERLSGISDILSGNQTEGDTESRQLLMQQSWKAFIDNPLTGSNKVGGHSYILDTMGHFGIWGVIFVIIVFSSLYRIFIQPFKDNPIYGTALLIFLIQIALCIVNTTIIEMMFYVILPMTAYVVGKLKSDSISEN